VVARTELSGVSNHTSPWRAREEEIERIARAQHDQITLAQLLDAGLSKSTVGDRVKNGRLFRSHRGVYSLGHPPTSPLENRMAAVLACGPFAALSHASGAANLGIRPSAAILIDVTSRTGAGRGIAGIRAHRSRLAPEDATTVNGVPTTTCARTLLDLAEVVSREALAKALDQAEIAGIFDLRALEDVERRILAWIERAGLPRPEVNATLELEGQCIEVDFLWRRERLVLEADGWRTHRTHRAFRDDRARDRRLLRAHYRTARMTWNDSRREVIATIRAALAADY
jgi:predicted transcriptional regulator of viral defense system